MIIDINSNYMITENSNSKGGPIDSEKKYSELLKSKHWKNKANIYYSEMEMYAKIVTDEVFIMEAISA